MSAMSPALAVRRPGRAAKREAILNAASDAFAAKGYGVSLEDVAFEANVSKQTIYNQFGSKEQLFREIVQLRAAQIRTDIEGEEAHARPPRDVLRKFAETYMRSAQSGRQFRLLRSLIAVAEQAPKVVAEFYELGPAATVRALSAWLASEHRLGRLAVPDPDLAAAHFLGACQGRRMLGGLLGLARDLTPAEIARHSLYCADLFMALHAPK